uniref:Uncharacterized protein n=1 Tax=Arundo donax TaxID=35708 RepID=A0A0A9F3H0_ARUDO
MLPPHLLRSPIQPPPPRSRAHPPAPTLYSRAPPPPSAPRLGIVANPNGRLALRTSPTRSSWPPPDPARHVPSTNSLAACHRIP